MHTEKGQNEVQIKTHFQVLKEQSTIPCCRVYSGPPALDVLPSCKQQMDICYIQRSSEHQTLSLQHLKLYVCK